MPNETTTKLDRTPRYAPDATMIAGHGMLPVQRWIAHPPGARRGCPIREDLTALELVTSLGSRWWGCERAWIGSDLRMRVSGFDARNELMRAWRIAPDA